MIEDEIVQTKVHTWDKCFLFRLGNYRLGTLTNITTHSDITR